LRRGKPLAEVGLAVGLRLEAGGKVG